MLAGYEHSSLFVEKYKNMIPPEIGDVAKVLGQFSVGGDNGASDDGAHLLALTVLKWL